MKKFLPHILFLVLSAAVAGAGSIYSWSSGQTLTASQLNSNFSHIHNNMVGGHGARLVDADVASNAAISRSKLSGSAGWPTAWAKVGSASTACNSTICIVGDSSGVSDVTRTSAGLYTVTFTTTHDDTEYGLLVSTATAGRICRAAVAGVSTATVTCFSDFATTAADAVFTITAFDSN